MQNSIRVTIISGFLGAGKTTLLKNILQENHEKKIALIVNDMAAIDIDGEIMAQAKERLVNTKAELVTLNNGCICCTLREDLVKSVQTLLETQPDIEYILVEPTGISEPLPIAQTFSYLEYSADTKAHLDSLITVIDASTFFNYVADNNSEEISSVTPLFFDQIEWANIIIVNKTDLVDEETLDKIITTLSHINPYAKIISSTYSNISSKNLLYTALFNQAESEESAEWQEELEKVHTPETEEYGISSISFSSNTLFHPQRLKDLLDATIPGLVRAKGFFVHAGNPGIMYSFAFAGKERVIEPACYTPTDSAAPLQQLVFIGINMNKKALENLLENALMKAQEAASKEELFKGETSELMPCEISMHESQDRA